MEVSVKINSKVSKEDFLKLSRFFSIFSDPSRLRILLFLLSSATPSCVSKIADALSMNQPAVSQQMRVLKDADIVKTERDGKFIRYSVNDEHVEEVINIGLSHINGGEE